MGNICRSPTAHGVMQDLVNRKGLEQKIIIESAGTHGYHVGERSDPRSCETAKGRGVDMGFIRAQKISVNDYDEFDYILAMDEDNLELINYYAPENYSATIALFLSFANADDKTVSRVVPDPYYGGDDGFDKVFNLVEIGCDSLLRHIQNA